MGGVEAQKQEVYFGKVPLKRVERGLWEGTLEEAGEKTSVRVAVTRTEEAFSKVVEADKKIKSSINFHTRGIEEVNDRIISANINECDCKKEMTNFNSAVIHIREIEGGRLPTQLPSVYGDFGKTRIL
ncbi:MAG: hypothetical protein Sv326_0072 [Candidatus Fermentimicrarchaeum limneticum]|uniref:Uncharacterized protein n=1 Tax=Fermentimicrarchaeum limneticum TaxID=2795018 RepID=A0A7D5XP78_FERL1|nr:MAG: hypothetical protein Sv326_0072 [Candidatus Fermentimicrarchaeum limneticum]